jgi:protoporphyrinogen/coproporphyrinogen III oxidase
VTDANVAVIGGGIAGLAAAYFLRTGQDGGNGSPGGRVRVTVFESSPRIGGKLVVSEVGGIPVDEGAEAMLARRPEGTGLATAAGLADQLVTPGTTSASIWTRGRLRPIPAGQVMGVPGDLPALARSGVVSPAGLARAALDPLLPGAVLDRDVSVTELVGGRFGREVVDRLVEPLLGGVYAGRADQLSFEATMPALAAAVRDGQGEPDGRDGRASRRGSRSLSGSARSMLAAAPSRDGKPRPVFTTLARGLGTLPAAVAAASGAEVRTGSTVRELRRTPSGWRLTVGSAHAPQHVDADAVVLALPARPASRLLAAEVPAAAGPLGEIEYASMAIVTLAYRGSAFPGPPGGSGYLVPAVDGRAVKAVTFSTVKWPHLTAGGHAVTAVRCSVGRIGEERLLQRADDELAKLAAAELAEAAGVRELPADVRVSRWGGALPQYTVGHAGRVSRIRTAVAGQPGLAVCGAAYDGLGIPACVATARDAATDVLSYLARPGAPA